MSRNILLNNNNSISNTNILSTNPLSNSTSQRRIGIRRRWESFRRNNQSAETLNRANPQGNITTVETEGPAGPARQSNNDQNINTNNTLDLNLGPNANSDNNLNINNNWRQNNLTNNIITSNNNDFHNNINNSRIINSNTNSRFNESPSTHHTRLRRLKYIGRHNRHLLLSIYNNNLIQDENNNHIDNHIITNSHNLNNNNEINHTNHNETENNINNNTNNNNEINNNINNSNNSNNNNEINNNNNINNSINSNNNGNIFSNANANEIALNNNINNNINSSITNSINIKKKCEKIKEEEKKREDTDIEICREENIGSEIKDTVKCYICFDKITKPKMCPHCHRIACEKCLYNWFVNLKKDKCGFCRLKSNFQEMVPVPFMDAVVNFVEKYFNKRNKLSETIDKEFLEYCPEHKNEMLYYYCLDCGKPYCKTCFVFFGEEKDKHNGHSIIEYEKYKNMSMPLLKKNTDKLETNIQHVEENIKRCLAYKNSYEHERKVVNKFIKNLETELNRQIDDNISLIELQIKKLRDYLDEYNKYKKEVEYFYGDIKDKKNPGERSCESLIIKLTKINQQKFFSSKDIEKLSELTKNFRAKTYQSKIGEFNHENMFLSKGLKMGSSPYELVIDNKQRNEVQISLTIPKQRTPIKHNFQAFIFIRQKGECVQTYDLDEYKEDENFYYLKTKIPWDYFGQSVFKIKGVLYDFYFE